MMKRLYTLGVPVFPMFMATPALAENLYRQSSTSSAANRLAAPLAQGSHAQASSRSFVA